MFGKGHRRAEHQQLKERTRSSVSGASVMGGTKTNNQQLGSNINSKMNKASTMGGTATYAGD